MFGSVTISVCICTSPLPSTTQIDNNEAIETRDCNPTACKFDMAGSVQIAGRCGTELVELTTNTGDVVDPYEFVLDGFMDEFRRWKQWPQNEIFEEALKKVGRIAQACQYCNRVLAGAPPYVREPLPQISGTS